MKNKFWLWVLVFLVFTNTPFLQSMADNGGDESGGGKSTAFDFVESTPGNSAKNVKLDEEIKLLFNKNVVHFTVKDNNSKCFSIKDAEGKETPIEVIFADDQIEPDKKREIILKPKKPFNEGTTYTIHISPELEAKNGSSLDKDVTISFSTLSLQSEEKDSVSKDNAARKDSTKPSDTTPVSKETTTDKDKKIHNVSQSENDTSVSSSDSENDKEDANLKDTTEPDLLEEDMGLAESDAGLNSADDSTEEQENPGTASKKYIWIVILVIVLVSAFIFKKKL